jgi:hypothetical protein
MEQRDNGMFQLIVECAVNLQIDGSWLIKSSFITWHEMKGLSAEQGQSPTTTKNLSCWH